jgi:von Willebrand factor type A domain
MTSVFFTEEKKEDKEAQQLKRNRVTRLASVFARANSVLTGKRITVNVVDNKSHKSPAWSSTTEVWLNLAEIKDDFSARSLTSLQGLDFHELAHLRYTPRNGHALPKWVRENNLWEAFNCLEDSRIENLLVGYLPTTANWLTATITDYLLSDVTAIETAFPLITGRKYLPAELQQLATDNYKCPNDIDELFDLVIEYNGFIFEGADNDTIERAKEVIKRYSELLSNLPPLPPKGNGGESGEGDEGEVTIYRVKNPHGHNDRPTEGWESSSNRPAKRSEQERDKNKSGSDTPRPKRKVKVVDVDSIDDVPEGATEIQPTTPTPSKSDDSDKSDSNADETSFDDLQFDEEDYADDDFDYGDDYSESGSKEVVGNQNGTTGDNNQVTDVLNDVLDDVVDELSKELNSIAKQLGISIGLDGGNAETPKQAKYDEVTCPADLVLLAKQFGKELERLRAKFEPAWENQVDTGRLNVNRYLQGEDFDTCFDEWQEGRADVTAIEAVILLDKSGSMSGRNADEAYKSMWAIKKSLENVQARTTVITFDYHSELLYGANDKAGSTIRDGGASGGTNPESAIMYAKRVLAETEKPIKILFMITDGAWDTKAGEEAVSQMREAGVLTCQAYLSQYEERAETIESYRHSFELLTHIKSAKDILVLGRDLVRLAIHRNLVTR